MHAILCEKLSRQLTRPVLSGLPAWSAKLQRQIHRMHAVIGMLCLFMIGTGMLWLPVARANGAPVEVFLSYLPNVSNWGPQDATGHAIVAIGEGEVTLRVEGLPRLDHGHYEVWLESRAERKLYSVGKFNAKADGTGYLAVLSDTLPYQDYRMLLITVEPDPDPSPEPDARWSIAGFLPNTVLAQITEGGVQGAEAGGLPGASSARQAGPRPPYLPVTGGNADSLWAGLGLLGALLLMGRICARKGHQP